MVGHHCGHIKAARLQYQWWCHQKAVSWGGLRTLCVDYVLSYQVLTVKDTTQQQLQSLLWPLGLDMIPGLTSFVDFDGPLKWQNIKFFCNEWKIACPFLSQRLSFMMDELIYLSYFSQRCIGCGGWWFGACGPARTRHSLSVKEPVSRLPLIYRDASAKLSHMALQPSWSLCWGYREA